MQVFIDLIVILASMNNKALATSMMQVIENNKLIKENIQILAIVEKLREKYNVPLDVMNAITKEVGEEIRENGFKSLLKD